MVSAVGCSQEKIFSFQEVDELKNWINFLPREHFFYERRNKRWGLKKIQPLTHRYENPNDSWFRVKFNENGDILDEKITLPFSSYKNYEVLKKVVSIALSWMAKQMGWQNSIRQMSLSIMQHYQLQKYEPTSAIGWHRDNSDHTLVILLDDETNWEGGRFLYKSETLESYLPKKGWGILFSNHGTLHSVESIIPKNHSIDRTIITLHEKRI